MVQYDATQLDALKENFTRAINIARERGAFETFSAKVNLGKVGLCENMFDDYKGDGVCEGWMWKTGGDVMQGYWHRTPHSCQWSHTVGQARDLARDAHCGRMRTRTPRQSVEFARAEAVEQRRSALGLEVAYRGLPAVRQGSM